MCEHIRRNLLRFAQKVIWSALKLVDLSCNPGITRGYNCSYFALILLFIADWFYDVASWKKEIYGTKYMSNGIGDVQFLAVPARLTGLILSVRSFI